MNGRSKSDLIAIGAEVSTTRIDTDAARLYGKLTAFLADASEEELDHAPMLTEHRVRCGVWAAYQATTKYEQREAQRKGAEVAKDKRAAEALQQIETGKARREALWANLRALAGGDAAWLQKIDAAYGTASDPKALADALASLAEVDRAMLAPRAMPPEHPPRAMPPERRPQAMPPEHPPRAMPPERPPRAMPPRRPDELSLSVPAPSQHGLSVPAPSQRGLA